MTNDRFVVVVVQPKKIALEKSFQSAGRRRWVEMSYLTPTGPVEAFELLAMFLDQDSIANWSANFDGISPLEVYRVLEVCTAMPDTVQPAVKFSLKSEAESCTAEEYFRNRNYSSALLYFNRALVSAETRQNLSRAYAGRAEVHFAKGDRESCAIDARRAYDEAKLSAVRRLEQLIELCDKGESKRDDWKATNDVRRQYLTFESTQNTRNRLITAANKDVSIKNAPGAGRGVFANKNIEVGQLIAQEEPYAVSLIREHFLERCYSCMRRCSCMIPCLGCEYVMFCGEACRGSSVHRYECPIMTYLVKSVDDAAVILALKTLLVSRKKYKSIEHLWEACCKAEVPKLNGERGFLTRGIANGGFRNQNVVCDVMKYCSESYGTVHSLDTNEEKLEFREKTEASIAAAQLVKLLKHKTEFFENGWGSFDEIRNRAFLIRFLYHNILINKNAMLNVQGVVLSASKKYVRDEHFANGIYAFSALFNHSCMPNVKSVWTGTTVALIASRPMKRREQLFISYGVNAMETSKEKRQQFLEKMYRFKCSCVACQNDMPLFNELPDLMNTMGVKTKYNNFIFQDIVEDMSKNNKRLIDRSLKKVMKNIDILYKHGFSSNLVLHEKLLEYCLRLFGNVRYTDDYDHALVQNDCPSFSKRFYYLIE